jgi:predicted DNA-binding transcriptional regulator AlpA
MGNRIEYDGGEVYLSPSAVARMLGISARQVLRLPIKRVRLGHHTIRYKQADVDEFLKCHTLSE